MVDWNAVNEAANAALQRLSDAACRAAKALSVAATIFPSLSIEPVWKEAEKIADSVSPLLQDIKPLSELIVEDCWDFVPPKVRHLAFHHPKARVRNKNWNRMWKIRERYMKNDKTESFPH